jgi:hypothetical protein
MSNRQVVGATLRQLPRGRKSRSVSNRQFGQRLRTANELVLLLRAVGYSCAVDDSDARASKRKH